MESCRGGSKKRRKNRKNVKIEQTQRKIHNKESEQPTRASNEHKQRPKETRNDKQNK